MGQKTNLLTLRFEKKNKINSNYNEFFFYYYFIKLLDFFFWQKKIFLTNSFLYSFENKIFFNFFIFFKVQKLSFFFNKYTKKKKKKKNLNKFNISSLFISLFPQCKNVIIFKFINLNYLLKKKKKKIIYFFKLFKKQGLLLFPRRFNFFLDFIQITILFLENKININFFIKIITEIFRILQKKRHSKFLSFFTFYFNFLFKVSLINNYSFKGIKMVINGKLKGKPRSSTFNKVFGSVPIQSLSLDIEYAQAHAFTLYGVFGIKLWVFRLKSNL